LAASATSAAAAAAAASAASAAALAAASALASAANWAAVILPLPLPLPLPASAASVRSRFGCCSKRFLGPIGAAPSPSAVAAASRPRLAGRRGDDRRWSNAPSSGASSPCGGRTAGMAREFLRRLPAAGGGAAGCCAPARFGGMCTRNENKGGGRRVTRRATSAIPPPPATRGAAEGSPEAIYDSVFCCLIENPATQNPATSASGGCVRAFPLWSPTCRCRGRGGERAQRLVGASAPFAPILL
jgi:hypothetical protein